MNFSIGTAAFFSALVEFALGIGILVLWLRQRSSYLIYWSSGFFLFSAGAVMVTWRDRIPDLLSIVVANLAITLSSIMFQIGICLFYGRRRSWVLSMLAVLVMEGALLAYYCYFDYNTTARVYSHCAAQTLIAWMTLHTLLAVGKERAEGVNPEVVVVTALFLVGHGARIAGTAFFPMPQDFLAAGNFQTLLAFGLMLIHINYALAFGNMHAFALQVDLSAALAATRASDRQKVELLGYISHDLRAPLVTISGYSKLLLADVPEAHKKPLQTIQRSVKYQLDLIDELLEYTKGELQPLRVQPATIDLPQLLDGISEFAVALCAQQDNRFRYQPSHRLPQQIVLDGKRMQQVLLNLLSNAAKFTHGGVVTLSVTAKPVGDFCTLHIAVSDTGIGMDLNQGVDIFGAFQQIQAQSGSNGLGLFIAQRILAAMGGTLSVTSKPGEGTEFSFALSVPVLHTSESEWPIIVPRGPERDHTCVASALPAIPMPDDPALEELAHLAVQGRLTDIENWIERHGQDPLHVPMTALVKDMLENFDFSGIQTLALQRGGHAKHP